VDLKLGSLDRSNISTTDKTNSLLCPKIKGIDINDMVAAGTKGLS
jgi:hypothetical protein